MERSCAVHGLHSNWKLRPVKQTWTCQLCRRGQRVDRVTEANYQALLEIFGKDIAEKYMTLVRAGKISGPGKKLKLK